MATQHLAPDSSVVLTGGFVSGTRIIFTRGEKLFELGNHLNNVLVTVSDRRVQVDSNSDGTVDSYKADITNANDYYPFGMVMPGRSYTASSDYRFGFNGKGKDKNISSLTAYDYGFRIYNPAIGKFLSVDPISRNYPMLTPYQFSSNSPIANIDLDGKEAKYYNITLTEDYDASGKLIKTTTEVQYNKAKEAGWHVHGIVPWYTGSGNLGDGTLYSVYKVTRKDKKDGEGMQVQEISKIGSIYTPPPPKVTKEHPASSFSIGIQIFGSGYDPDEAPTSKANADMKVISFNFKEFQEIMEPVLLGMDAKVPSDLLPPKLDEIIEAAGKEAIDQAIDKLNKKWDAYERKTQASETKFIKCASCNGIKRVGESDDSIFFDDDTTKKGATQKNTKVVPFNSFHD
jgi:RHS repeat-associated protein